PRVSFVGSTRVKTRDSPNRWGLFRRYADQLCAGIDIHARIENLGRLRNVKRLDEPGQLRLFLRGHFLRGQEGDFAKTSDQSFRAVCHSLIGQIAIRAHSVWETESQDPKDKSCGRKSK
ncbi:hypothetical protein R5H32_20180, partial [Defluviimonas sp. D31]|uniref:hypothetical protein n=1 Tax=Defluviimonas sp. D31 TaxID=3083253 RepID=UPI00296F478E